MTRLSSRALAAARPVIRGLGLLNLLYALALGVLFGIGCVVEDWPHRLLGFARADAHPRLAEGLLAMMLIAIAGAGIVHAILGRLLAIVDSVRGGDPFIEANARHLDAIAWRVVALEVLRLCVAAIASVVWESGHVGGFSFTPWLAVLMLFVLSGVFAQGARMRADLEGTV
jgi:hypothetical protein